MARKKYGVLPPAPVLTARVRGDAGAYRVWGIDWLHGRVLIDRAGVAWVPVENVALDPLVPPAGAALPSLLRDLREQIAGDIESPSNSEPEYSQRARLLVARVDAMLAAQADSSDPIQEMLAMRVRLENAEARAEDDA